MIIISGFYKILFDLILKSIESANLNGDVVYNYYD